MTPFGCPEIRATLAAVCRDMTDGVSQCALRDAVLEAGLPEPVAGESAPFRRLGPWDVWSFGIGIGSGIGSGIGIGRGRGSGSGSGIGIGRGRGIGRGIGIGRGSGSGRGSTDPYRMRPMIVGKAYLIHCGDWHTFVGRVVEQIGPFTYLLESVSKIAETRNADCWEQLAAGNERLRRACDYRHHTTRAVIPLTLAAFEWLGQTPQEAGIK